MKDAIAFLTWGKERRGTAGQREEMYGFTNRYGVWYGWARRRRERQRCVRIIKRLAEAGLGPDRQREARQGNVRIYNRLGSVGPGGERNGGAWQGDVRI